MTEEEGGGASAMMIVAYDNGGRGDRRPSHRHWWLEFVLPSPVLPPSRDDSGLRGAPKPVARCANAVSDTIVPARCTVAGATASCGRKKKAEAETTTMTTTTRTTRKMPVPAISRRQGGFNNQQGWEVAMEGNGVGTDGRTMMAIWDGRCEAVGVG